MGWGPCSEARLQKVRCDYCGSHSKRREVELADVQRTWASLKQKEKFEALSRCFFKGQRIGYDSVCNWAFCRLVGICKTTYYKAQQISQHAATSPIKNEAETLQQEANTTVQQDSNMLIDSQMEQTQF